MKYNFTRQFKTKAGSRVLLGPSKAISKNFYTQNFWKFLFFYEIFSSAIMLIIFSFEILDLISRNADFKKRFIANITVRVMKILINLVVFALYESKYKNLKYGNRSNQRLMLLNQMIDILVYCNLDLFTLPASSKLIYLVYIILKTSLFSYLFQSFFVNMLSCVLFILYSFIYQILNSGIYALLIIEGLAVIISCFFLILGCKYYLSQSKKNEKDNFFAAKKKLNPFLEIIPEGIMIIKTKPEIKLVYNNQHMFKVLEIDNFTAQDLNSFSDYLSNIISQENKDRESPLVKSAKIKSYKIYENLFELITSLSINEDSDSENFEDKERFFIASRIEKNNPEKELFKLEVTVKKIKYNKSEYFIIMIQSMALKAMIKNLQQQDDFKCRLLSSFSHELKTPLNGTIPCLEILLNEENIALDLKETYIIPSLSSLKLLESTINDIIDFSLISTDQIILNIKPINFPQLINEINSLLKPVLSSKSLNLIMNVDNLIVNPFFYSDFGRIKQILLNILINAIKFTNSEGSIFVKIESGFRRNFECIDFEIKDTGIGMSDEKIKDVQLYLKKISMDDDNNSGLCINSTGAGFGLLITQKILLLLGFEDNYENNGLIIESKQNFGTIVRFTLADKKTHFMASKNEVTIPEIKSDERPATKKKKTVLIDSVKIEFKRKKNLSLQKSHKTESIESMPIQIPSQNNEFESGSYNIDLQNIIKSYDFNQSLKFLDQNIIPRNFANINMGSFPNIKNNIHNVNNNTNNNSNYSDNHSAPLNMFNSLDYINEKKNQPKVCQCEDVLTVDDDIFNLLSLEMLLKPWKLKVKKAMNGEEAVNAVKFCYKEKRLCCKGFKAIFMDYQMPIKDGVQATEELIEMMNKKLIPVIPIIGCTAFVTKNEVNRCFESGMKDVIFKPLSKTIISEIVSNWIMN